MSSRIVLACVVAGLIVAGASAGADGAGSVPGVTPTSIRLGGTFPLTGEASGAAAIAGGARAYFRYVNAHGGLFGRKIDFRYRDDGFDAARTVTATQQLVTQDKVFAIFGSYGTEQNLAVRPLLNKLGVPQLFVSSGATELGSQAKRYPWTIGYPVSFAVEGRLLARDILKARSTPRIGVLYENDEFGRGLLNGLRRGLGVRKSAIVAAQPYDPAQPDVRVQMQRLKASKATTFANFAFGKFAIDAYMLAAQIGWRPKTYISSTAGTDSVLKIAASTAGRAATDGTVSVVFSKDPSSPTIASDLGFQLFKSIVAAYDRGVRTNDGYALYGMAAAYTMVDALRRAGKNLTRRALLGATTKINEQANPFLLSGVEVRTGVKDRFPIDQARLQRWQNGRWIEFGPLLTG
jgi:branched-chain amino acid transport system substrate-binding protein